MKLNMYDSPTGIDQVKKVQFKKQEGESDIAFQ